MSLSDSDFKKLIEIAPLISIDFIIENEQQEFLLGLRNNRPASGFYFVPGGRIYKNETFEQAVARISEKELGIQIKLADLLPMGSFEQFYNENFYDHPNTTTHYVALPHRVKFKWNKPVTGDQQHANYRFFSQKKLLEEDHVHPYCKRYFA